MASDMSGSNNKSEPRHSRPVCKIPPAGFGNRWFFHSPTLNRIVAVASDLEYDACVTIEACRDTKWFCEQPRRVKVNLPCGMVTTIFDFWIQYMDYEEEYWEIKYYSQIISADGRLARQIEAQRTWCEQHAFKYVLLTDLVIRGNPIYLENWKTVLRLLAMTADINLEPVTKRIVRILLRVREVAINNIERIMIDVDRTLVRAALYLMLHRGELDAPLDREVLTPSMRVKLRE